MHHIHAQAPGPSGLGYHVLALWLPLLASCGAAADSSDGGAVGTAADARPELGDSSMRPADAMPGSRDARPADPDGGAPFLDGPNQLISDRHFRRGFIANDPVTGADLGTMNPNFASGDTVWRLGQWGSLSSLDATAATTLSNGAVRWQDTYGAVTLGAPDSGEADLSLRVNARTEYGGVYYNGPNATRTTWVHLLGEQRLSPPGTAGPGCPPLSELSELKFSVDGRLSEDNRNLQTGFDASKHAAQYLIYFTVQNLDMTSAGYGDYLWFGLTLYDDRDPYPALYVQRDDFTQKLIYNIGLQSLTSSGLDNNQWHSLSEDLLPHIRNALRAAWGEGYLSNSRDLSKYRLGGMNLGWEIPGLNRAELQISKLSLTFQKASVAELRYDFNSDGDTEGWTASNAQPAAGSPTGGQWQLSVPGNDPALLSPVLRIAAASYSTLSVTIANDGNPAPASVMQVFWSRFGTPGYREADSSQVAISNDGALTTYRFDLSAIPAWTGEINQLRIDPILSGDGNRVRLDSVVLTP